MFIGTNVITAGARALWLRRQETQRVAARDAFARSRTPPSPALPVRRPPSRLSFGACRVGQSLRMMTEVPPLQPCREDVLLGQLVFMRPELLPKFIEENLEEFDAAFYEYLQQKIDKSTDLEERVTLNTLKDAITDLMNELLRKHGTEMKHANPTEAEAISEAQSQRQHEEMYRNLVQHADDTERLQVAVSANYDRFTADFLNYIFGKAHSEEANSPAVARVSQAINDEMKSRMEKAAQRLTEVLRGGSPNEMTKKMREIGSAGGIDEAFMLLLAANTERAKKEGANVQVLQILEQLREQASRIIDEAVKDKELRLVRALLRTEDPEKRRQLLFAAFSPKDRVFLPSGAEPDAEMEIDGKRFLEIIKELIEKYGSVDPKLVSRCREIGDQAEEVARELLELIGKDPRELQDEAWLRSVSVFELERMEIQAEMEGRKMPWQERPPGFDEQGRRHL